MSYILSANYTKDVCSQGVLRENMKELVSWVRTSDKVITF